MKSIDVATKQNVIITYQLASFIYRLLAWLIDITIILVLSFLLFLTSKLSFSNHPEIIGYMLVVPLFVFYSLAFEYFNNGQSPGKKALKIRVILLDGNNPGFLNYFMRWIVRGLDIYSSLGGIATLSIGISNNSQRLGDVLASTIVVNVDKSERIKLNNLLKLNKLKDYQAMYPNVALLTESDMLIVKETLDKSTKFNNPAHNKALELLIEKLVAELQLEKAPQNQRVFLRTLLKDYVALTR